MSASKTRRLDTSMDERERTLLESSKLVSHTDSGLREELSKILGSTHVRMHADQVLEDPKAFSRPASHARQMSHGNVQRILQLLEGHTVSLEKVHSSLELLHAAVSDAAAVAPVAPVAPVVLTCDMFSSHTHCGRATWVCDLTCDVVCALIISCNKVTNCGGKLLFVCKETSLRMIPRLF